MNDLIKEPKTKSDYYVNSMVSAGIGYRRNGLHKFMESRGYGRVGPHGEQVSVSKKGDLLFDYRVIPDAWRWHRYRTIHRGCPTNLFELELVEAIETSPITTRKASAYFNADDRRVDGLVVSLTSIDRMGKFLCYREPCSEVFDGMLVSQEFWTRELRDMTECDDFTSRCIANPPRIPRLTDGRFQFGLLSQGMYVEPVYER